MTNISMDLLTKKEKTMKNNDLQICITLNGSSLCRDYTIEELEEIDSKVIAKQLADILDTLKKADGTIFDVKKQ